MFSPTTVSPDNGITITVTRSLGETLRIFALGMVRGTLRTMMIAWITVLLVPVPAIVADVLWSLDHSPHRARTALLFLLGVPLGVLAILPLILRWSGRGLQSVVLRPGEILLVRRNGATRVVRDGLREMSESERLFLVRVEGYPWPLTIDKRSLSPAGIGTLRRLAPRQRAAGADTVAIAELAECVP